MKMRNLKAITPVKVKNSCYSLNVGVGLAIPSTHNYSLSRFITTHGNGWLEKDAEVEKVSWEALDLPAIRLEAITIVSDIHLGSDPEVMVVGRNGVIIPAWEFLPSKDEKSYNEINLARTFWDGFQAEFTMHPSTCIAYVVDGIQEGLSSVLKSARKYDPTATLSPACVIDVPRDLMNEASDEHVNLGCSPSINAYNASTMSVGSPRELPFRFAGFHIHLGIGECKEEAGDIVKAIDMLAGVASVALLAGLEDNRRRVFYGRAGEYRLPEHGLEYRTLSSAALIHPVAVHVLIGLIRASYQLARAGFSPWKPDDERVQGIINNCDVDDARAYLKEHSEELTPILKRGFDGNNEKPMVSEKVTKLLEKGIISCINLKSMEENWLIDGKRDWRRHSGSPGCSVAMAEFKT